MTTGPRHVPVPHREDPPRPPAGAPLALGACTPGDPWTIDAGAVAAALGVDPARGLDTSEAERRREVFGTNELQERRTAPPWLLLAGQFANAMILVLIAAAAITAAIGDLKDAAVILAIVVLNGVIGFVQEFRAERAMEALRRLTSPTARVMRDGERRLVPAPALVPGDIVALEAGDIVAADLRLLETHALRINEAALTGESEPADKSSELLPLVTAALHADQRNMAFSGTPVTHGRGTGIVVNTGMNTAIGRVAALVQQRGPGTTPLQRRLGTLGRRMALAAVVVCGLVFASGIARGEPVDSMFLVAVSLAVAAIPEGLPAVVTVALALGARRMAQRRSLVRKLTAVETLGSVTTICTDKTGTLTENRMVVEVAWTPDGVTYEVQGDGYVPEGQISPRPTPGGPLDLLARVVVACNDASLTAPGTGATDWTVDGDPTEGALLAFGEKLGITKRGLASTLPRVAELTFDAGRRRMATVHAEADGHWVAVKGALESIGPQLAQGQKDQLRAATIEAERIASAGYRVLAAAERSSVERSPSLEQVEGDLTLVGLVGMADPPRPEAFAAIAACRAAGITPVMITGDHPLTAQAIARRLGMLGEHDRVLTGVDLDRLDDDAFRAIVDDVRVYARTNPEQKLRIVNAWQERGAIVSMTGDGVNDAPALRSADIGVAMGITGTEVSREAADMVLADDNFATIVSAVEEGRRIYDNIRRFVRYMLTTNSAEILVMALAPFIGLPLPLLAVQILWVNLVTDGFPALALGVEQAERGAMRRPPRPTGESIFGRGLWQHAVWVGLFMAVVTLGIQSLAIANDWPWQSMTFTTLALLQLGHALAVRSERESTFRLGFLTNIPLLVAVVATAAVQVAILYVPFLEDVFSTQPLGPLQLGIVLIASTAVFFAVEVEKALFRRIDGPVQNRGGSPVPAQ